MHYTIERVNKDEPFGPILDSMRRAGNEPGKAQAFALARQLGKKHPEDTIFVNEILGRDEDIIVAVVNANDDIKFRYPDIDYLDKKKHAKLQKLFLETLNEEVKKGLTTGAAREVVIQMLVETRSP